MLIPSFLPHISFILGDDGLRPDALGRRWSDSSFDVIPHTEMRRNVILLVGSLFSLPSQFKPLAKRGLFFTEQTNHRMRRTLVPEDVSSDTKSHKVQPSLDSNDTLPTSKRKGTFEEERYLMVHDSLRQKLGKMLVNVLQNEVNKENLLLLIWVLCAKVLEDAQFPGIAQIVISVVMHKLMDSGQNSWAEKEYVVVQAAALQMLAFLAPASDQIRIAGNATIPNMIKNLCAWVTAEVSQVKKKPSGNRSQIMSLAILTITTWCVAAPWLMTTDCGARVLKLAVSCSDGDSPYENGEFPPGLQHIRNAAKRLYHVLLRDIGRNESGQQVPAFTDISASLTESDVLHLLCRSKDDEAMFKAMGEKMRFYALRNDILISIAAVPEPPTCNPNVEIAQNGVLVLIILRDQHGRYGWLLRQQGQRAGVTFPRRGSISFINLDSGGGGRRHTEHDTRQRILPKKRKSNLDENIASVFGDDHNFKSDDAIRVGRACEQYKATSRKSLSLQETGNKMEGEGGLETEETTTSAHGSSLWQYARNFISNTGLISLEQWKNMVSLRPSKLMLRSISKLDRLVTRQHRILKVTYMKVINDTRNEEIEQYLIDDDAVRFALESGGKSQNTHIQLHAFLLSLGWPKSEAQMQKRSNFEERPDESKLGFNHFENPVWMPISQPHDWADVEDSRGDDEEPFHLQYSDFSSVLDIRAPCWPSLHANLSQGTSVVDAYSWCKMPNPGRRNAPVQVIWNDSKNRYSYVNVVDKHVEFSRASVAIFIDPLPDQATLFAVRIYINPAYESALRTVTASPGKESENQRVVFGPLLDGMVVEAADTHIF